MCQLAGRPLPGDEAYWPDASGGGKSGLQGSTVAANGRRGRPQGKCHRDETALAGRPTKVRVKRCGKSAPRLRQRRRHGKPHREQDRIGAARAPGSVPAFAGAGPATRRDPDPPPGLVARGAERSAPQMNGRRGGPIPPDRTRLTGQLATNLPERNSRSWEQGRARVRVSCRCPPS